MTFPQSKSSLETLRDCPWKFGQVYILGKRGEPSKAAQAGTLVHKRLEVWRNTGELPDKGEVWEEYKIGEIAHAMISVLPPYGTPGITTEKDESFSINGLEYRAIKDWTSEDTLGDYKTTSNITADHVLDEQTILQDIQAMLSARSMDRDLWLDWTYGQTKGKPRVKKVRLKVIKQDVNNQFTNIVEPLTVRALDILERNDPESLGHLKNKSSCFKYGKCHLYEECWGVPEKAVQFYMSGNGLLEKLNALKTPAEKLQAIKQSLDQVVKASSPATPVEDPVNPPVVAVTPPPAEEPTPEVKRHRGRPKKEAPTNGAPLAIVEPNAPTRAIIVDKAKPIRTLYCDCLPLGNHVVHAHELIAKAAQTVCSDMQVLNIKLIDFGKGGACLSAQLEADILQLEPGFDLALTTRTVEGREVYQTLMSLAQNIVVGL